MRNIIHSFLIAVALISCKENATEEISVSSDMDMIMPEMPVSASVSEGTKAKVITLSSEQKIIKNAQLRFETSNLEATGQNVYASVKKYNAQIQSDNESNSNYSLSRTIVVRIPSGSFDAFITDISKGVTYFDVKDISSQDVTEEYIDLEARIKAKKVLETRYLELLKKAAKVSEVLEIEKELSAIREDIEVFEGKLRYMQSRVSLSTVHIEFYKDIESGGGSTVSYISKIGNALKSGFNMLSTFFLGLLHVWPFIIIFVIAFVLIRKRIRTKK